MRPTTNADYPRPSVKPCRATIAPFLLMDRLVLEKAIQCMEEMKDRSVALQVESLEIYSKRSQNKKEMPNISYLSVFYKFTVKKYMIYSTHLP